MSKVFLSPFQLLDSWIEEVSFETIDASLTESSATVSLSHSFDGDELDRDNVLAIKGNISVDCKWQDEEEKTICQGTCVVRGAVTVFKSAFENNGDELKFLLKANVVSLLYGKARNTLEILSANSRAGKKTLPSIDPFEYLEAANASKE